MSKHTTSKYLAFHVAGEDYAVPILKVREITAGLKMNRVPGTAPYVTGIINYRGRIVPVVDLRLRFELPELEDDARACIVVCHCSRDERPYTAGLKVDLVTEVVNIADDEVEPVPSVEATELIEAITGIARVDKRTILLLDLDVVVSLELSARLAIAAATKAAAELEQDAEQAPPA